MITEPLKRLSVCYWMRPRTFVEAKFLDFYTQPPAVRVMIQGKDFILKPNEVVTPIQKEVEFKRMKREQFEKKYEIEIGYIRNHPLKNRFKKWMSKELNIPYSRVFLVFREAKQLGVDLYAKETEKV